MGENAELFRRVSESLSGTIHEQLRSLVHEVRDAMQSFSDASSNLAVSQQHIDRTVAELARRAEVIGADTNDSLEIVRTDIGDQIEAEADRLSAEISARTGDISATLAGITKRLESVEHSVELIRFQLTDGQTLSA
jgi:methyl-accepting chemotaxis protein